MKLSRKLGIIFTVVLFSFSALLILFQSLFLNRFYMLRKKASINNAYVETKNYIVSEFDEIIDKDILLGASMINENIGTVLSVYDVDGESISKAGREWFKSLSELQMEDDNGNNVVLSTREILDEMIPEKGEYFEFEQTPSKNQIDPKRNIAIIGKLVKDEKTIGYVIVYSSYTMMMENTRITSGFTLYLTLILLLFGVIASSFISATLTRDIREAEEKTRQMANLDFSTKLEIRSNDEIGHLSISINRLSDELEKSINDLKEANKTLEKDIELKERINRLREEFISDVSHELKTPISIIGGYSEALKLEGLSQDDINYYADIIIDESKRMNKLVKDLLKFTQIESGFLNLEKEDFSVVEMLDDVIKPNELRFSERHITLKTDIDDIIVNGDFDMMRTVFNNFFSNAFNHVEGENIVEVTGKVVNIKYRISVRNTGKTISEENQVRIWDSFYKVDKSRSRQYGGTGLGLAIVKSIMTAYKNNYGVMNNEDGVTFYFELNLAQSKEEKGN